MASVLELLRNQGTDRIDILTDATHRVNLALLNFDLALLQVDADDWFLYCTTNQQIRHSNVKKKKVKIVGLVCKAGANTNANTHANSNSNSNFNPEANAPISNQQICK